VVVDGSGRHARPRRFERGLEPRVDVGSTAGNGEVPASAADRSLHYRARVDEIGLHERAHTVTCRRERRERRLVDAWIFHRDVEDTASVPTEVRAEVARVEVDVIEHLRGDDARQTAEVIDDRDERAVDVRARLLRSGTTNDEEAGDARRSRHAGEVLDR